MRVTDKVQNILWTEPKTRSSDKELLIAYMQSEGMDLDYRQIAIFKSMPSTETIRRVRQKIQENGLYQATDTITKERNWRAMRMQQNMPSAKPNTVENIIAPPQAISWLSDD